MMNRVDLLAAATNDLLAAGSNDAGSTLRLILVIGGLALAFAAFRVTTFLGSMLTAALQAVSALFAIAGRTVAVGLIGLGVAGLAVFVLGSGPDAPAMDQSQPPTAAQPQ